MNPAISEFREDCGMPSMHVAPDLDMFYLVDDYTDPWTQPQTVLLLPGLAESCDAWYAWGAHLARAFRVVRPDMRGFGKSTAMSLDYAWRLDTVVDDFISLMDGLGIEKFYVAAAKIGGDRRAPTCRK